MRILIAHDRADMSGGVEAYLASLVPALIARGHHVLALQHWQTRNGSAWGSGSESVCIEQSGAAAALARVREWQPDVCFSHNMGPLATERLLLGEWPVVKMMHGYFGTCVSGLKTHGFPSMRPCQRTFGRACLALYAPRRCGQLSIPVMSDGYRWSVEQQTLLSRYAAVVVASDHMRQEYARHGMDRKRLHVLPLFSTLAEDGPMVAADEGGSVLFAGRMTRHKGGHVLIAAAWHAARLIGRSVPLLFAGDGPQRAEWEELATSTGVSAQFTGWIAPHLRAAVYGRAVLAAVPSLWPEPFGLIGLEAASLGIPAVAFDVGGVRQWLEPGRSGVVVPPSAGSEGLGSAIAALLDDPTKLRQLGTQARIVSARLSCAAHVDDLVALLSQVSCTFRRSTSCLN